MWLKCSLYGEKLFLTLTGGYFLRTLDNSNFFRFPLKIRIISGVDYIYKSSFYLQKTSFLNRNNDF